jgi:hypothetical protein
MEAAFEEGQGPHRAVEAVMIMKREIGLLPLRWNLYLPVSYLRT